MSNRKITILIIIVLVTAIVSLGIAFAAFSRNLVIGGNASVVASTWDIVFEGVTNTNTIDDPVLTGTANEVVHPTIGSNGTSIGNYSVTLTTPGDSVTYNFKVHNKGDYAGSVTSIVMNSGVNLTTDTEKRTSEANTLGAMDYKLYYTDNNELVGQSAKDCLEPGESENVTLRIIFSSTDATNTNILPSSDLLLDNLGVTVNYLQANNGSCLIEGAGEAVSNKAFQNIEGAYYTYEEKSFIGTGVNNLLISGIIIGKAAFASTYPGTNNGDGTYTFSDSPAADMASAYCTGCRLMTKDEAASWAGCTSEQVSEYTCTSNKMTVKYEGSNTTWWLGNAYKSNSAWLVTGGGNINRNTVSNSIAVRPAVSIPSGATITGSGTKDSPYAITINN